MDSQAEFGSLPENNKPKEFPTNPEKRFEALFSALGNSEAKCLTLLCLSESPVSEYDLHRRFVDENRGAWKPNRATVPNYCQQTLEPIGLVAEADVIKNGSNEHIAGYRLTEAGRKFGQPVAAFLLQQSQQFKFSLIEIFGITSTAGKNRAVLNRARILENLSLTSNPSVNDISIYLGIEGSTISSHLQYLVKLGIVNFESISAENPGQVKYKIIEAAQSTRGSKVIDALPAKILKVISTREVVSLDEVARSLYPDYQNEPFTVFRRRLSVYMAGLENEGACKRIELQGNLRSKASLNETGVKIVSEVIEPIKQALSVNENLLSEWSRIDWRKFAPQAVEKYKEVKPNQNRKKSEGVLKTLAIILENPGIRRKDLSKILGRHPGSYLTDLFKANKIRSVGKSRATIYFPVVSTSSDTDSQKAS